MAAISLTTSCRMVAAATTPCPTVTSSCFDTVASAARCNDHFVLSSLNSSLSKMREVLSFFPISLSDLHQSGTSVSVTIGLEDSSKPHCSIFLATTRRSMLLLLTLGVGGSLQAKAAEELDPSVDLELESFADEEEGFQLLKPAKWNRVSKAGATVLFEDPVTKSNNLGVVVNPVRISSLREFGSPQDVARKLIASEQKKPSTNAASLIAVRERLLNNNIPLYEYEYKLDSSRGLKRVFGAVTIASKKLYILNVTYKDTKEVSLSSSISEKMHTIVTSFGLLQ